MTEKEKQELEQRRRENAITSLYFNRYLLVRYATALALFIYLYWTVMLYLAESPLYIIALPISMLLFSSLAMWEMAQMYTRKQRSPKITKLLYKVILGINVVMIILCLAQRSTLFFPLFHTSVTSLSIIIGAHVLGIMGSLGILLRLKKIEAKTDKQFRRIKTYLASVT